MSYLISVLPTKLIDARKIQSRTQHCSVQLLSWCLLWGFTYSQFSPRHLLPSSLLPPPPCPLLPSAAGCWLCAGLCWAVTVPATMEMALLFSPALLSPCACSSTDPSTAHCADKMSPCVCPGWASCWSLNCISSWRGLVSTRASSGFRKWQKVTCSFSVMKCYTCTHCRAFNPVHLTHHGSIHIT